MRFGLKLLGLPAWPACLAYLLGLPAWRACLACLPGLLAWPAWSAWLACLALGKHRRMFCEPNLIWGIRPAAAGVRLHVGEHVTIIGYTQILDGYVGAVIDVVHHSRFFTK